MKNRISIARAMLFVHAAKAPATFFALYFLIAFGVCKP